MHAVGPRGCADELARWRGQKTDHRNLTDARAYTEYEREVGRGSDDDRALRRTTPPNQEGDGVSDQGKTCAKDDDSRIRASRVEAAHEDVVHERSVGIVRLVGVHAHLRAARTDKGEERQANCLVAEHAHSDGRVCVYV